MITAHHLLEALPVIASLVMIEGLLSVDNALAIAVLASHLPGKQKQLALRLGIIGAYLFRGVALWFAAWISQNPGVKWFGAAYLIYLMCSHLTQAEDGEGEEARRKKRPGLWATILQIEVMDLSLSVDNVVAAVALAPIREGHKEMWVVYAGVFIGILALRFLAGYCIRLLQKYPILAQTAFLLVGFVGFLLIFELLTGAHIRSWQKFLGVALITALTLLYDRVPAVKTLFQPLVAIGFPLMRWFARVLDGIFWPLRKLHERIERMLRRKPAAANEVRQDERL